MRGVIVHQHGAGRNAAEHGAVAAYDPPLAGAGEEVGLRSARPDPSRTERRDRHDAGRLAALVRSRHGGPTGSFLRALEELGSSCGPHGVERGSVDFVGTFGRRNLVRRDDGSASRACFSSSVSSLRDGNADVSPPGAFRQPQVPAAAYAIPILANAGVKEQKDGWERRTVGGFADDFPGVPSKGRFDRFRARSANGTRSAAIRGTSRFRFSTP